MSLRVMRSRAFSSIELGQVDAGDRAVARIQAGVDAGADADFEHPIARPDAHALNRLDASGVEGGTEGEVVDLDASFS